MSTIILLDRDEETRKDSQIALAYAGYNVLDFSDNEGFSEYFSQNKNIDITAFICKTTYSPYSGIGMCLSASRGWKSGIKFSKIPFHFYDFSGRNWRLELMTRNLRYAHYRPLENPSLDHFIASVQTHISLPAENVTLGLPVNGC